MVTVEVDPVRVESRLAAGEIGCPGCGGVLGGWGHARARRIAGLADLVRPRRARCRACAVTHVLLPVSVLLRRAYAAEQIWSVWSARTDGLGHRRIAAVIRVPAATVRVGCAGGGSARGDQELVLGHRSDRRGGRGDPRRGGVPMARCAGRG